MITYLGIGLLALFLSSLTRDLLNKVVGVVVYLSKTKWSAPNCSLDTGCQG